MILIPKIFKFLLNHTYKSMYLDLISKYCSTKDQKNCTHLGMVAHAYNPHI